MAEPEQLLLEAPPEFDEANGLYLESGSDYADREYNDKSEQDGDSDFEPGQELKEDVSDDSAEDASLGPSPEEMAEELKLLGEDDVGSDNNPLNFNKCSVEDLTAIRAAFPLLSIPTIEKELCRQDQNLRKTYDALKRTTVPSLSFDDMMDRMIMGLLDQSESSPTQPTVPDIFNPRPPATKPLIEVVSHYETDSASTSDSSDDETSSDNASSDDDDSSSNGGGSSDDESGDDWDDGSSDDSSDDSSDESSSDSDESDSGPECVTAAPKPAVVKAESAPFAGLTKTQKRNARRRLAKLSGKVGTTTPDLGDAELRARKEALLGALSEGTSPVPEVEQALAEDLATQTPGQSQNETSPKANDSSAQRRARVDMGAGRRMLFGALGLKNPKSKADEERMKQDMLKDIKPLKNPRIIEVVDEDEAEIKKDPADGDDDEWKSKITYRAVECCHEGMVLSEPPFPFVQRWDPQQQYGSMRKRKRQSENYYDDSYVEENSGMAAEETRMNGTESRPNNRKSEGGHDLFGNPVNGIEEVEDAPGDASEDVVTNGINDHAQEQEDLPTLPEDMSSLAVLEKGTATEGMVITWKQCIMSKATQWQPVIASVTGEVLPGSSESSLEIRLAFRDREFKEKLYDEKGQRIYDKFETPDFEDEDEEEDDGCRTIGWDEMIEPKVVQTTSPWASTNGAKAE